MPANPPEQSATLRDRFAYQAMGGLLSYRGTDRKPILLARNAYALADALLEQRGPEAGAAVTLRDRLAELALHGLVSLEGTSVRPPVLARMAYEIADAMLEAREAE
jgi:hypothetical protein